MNGGARRTGLLIVLVMVAGVCAAGAWMRLNSKHDEARQWGAEFSTCQRLLGELAETKQKGAARTAAAGAPDEKELNQRVMEAAKSAGLVEARLPSVEPGQVERADGGDAQALAVVLRFGPVTIKELTTFLHDLSVKDASVLAREIRLGTPPGQDVGELWTAEVTLSYLARK